VRKDPIAAIGLCFLAGFVVAPDLSRGNWLSALGLVALVFYIIICGIGCAIPSRAAQSHDRAGTPIYHTWILTAAGA
jgi:hypothetical protein